MRNRAVDRASSSACPETWIGDACPLHHAPTPPSHTTTAARKRHQSPNRLPNPRDRNQSDWGVCRDQLAGIAFMAFSVLVFCYLGAGLWVTYVEGMLLEGDTFVACDPCHHQHEIHPSPTSATHGTNWTVQRIIAASSDTNLTWEAAVASTSLHQPAASYAPNSAPAVETGWSRHHVTTYSPDTALTPSLTRSVVGPYLLLKAWDTVTVFCPEWTLQAGLRDNGYSVHAYVELVNMTQGRIAPTARVQSVEASFPARLGLQSVASSRGSLVGDTHIRSDPLTMRWSHGGGPSDGLLSLSSSAFASNRGLAALAHTPSFRAHQPLTTVKPVTGRGYQYMSRKVAVPVSGWVQVDGSGQKLLMEPGACTAAHEWRRGAHAYRTSWRSLVASTTATAPASELTSKTGPLPSTLGLVISDGNGNQTLASDCAILANGEVHKLARVLISQLSQSPLEEGPTRFTVVEQAGTGASPRLNATFTAAQTVHQTTEKQHPTVASLREAVNALEPLAHAERRLHGHISGTVLLDTGVRVRFRNMPAIVQDWEARW